jgi:hypothetical protein
LTTQFSIINEDFANDLEAIRILVGVFNDPGKSPPKVRIAAANSATLLLAATFEQFIREMARAYAQAVVAAAPSFKEIPKRLAETAWRRTMATLAQLEIDDEAKVFAEGTRNEALRKFNSVYEFCKGDKTQDVYEDLIHNENNMRPAQINALFRLSDLKDACSRVATKTPLLDSFEETDPNKVHGLLLVTIDEFFKRRNEIAHALNITHSSGPDQIMKDVSLFEAFGTSLSETLTELTKVVLDQLVDRVLVKNGDGSIFQVHSVPVGSSAFAYAKSLKEKQVSGSTRSYVILLRKGQIINFEGG